MPHQSAAAVTLIECICVLAALFALAWFLLMPTIHGGVKSSRINCVNNLKNVGLAFRTAAVDTGEFIFRLPETVGCTARHAVNAIELWSHFAALSNELSTPKIIACPSDVRRATSNTWGSVALTDRNRALSYTLGLDAREEQPQSILSGDRNLTLDGLPVGMGVLRLATNSLVGFNTNIHVGAGNLLLGDGSVQQVTSGRQRESVADAVVANTNNLIRIVVP